MNTNNKIKLVVVNGHTLGYILPELPNQLNVLHSSILKGAVFKMFNDSTNLSENDIRIANQKDFNDFNVCFNGYKNNPNEYEFL